MIVKRIILKNWGPHKHLEWDTNAPVVGLIGPNGSGKTNLLEALSFVFTGKLAKNNEGKQARRQESYIYSYKGEQADNASVELHFSKDSIEGKIFRQIGKTSKRWLKWAGIDDGKPITVGKEIDRVLEEILDCDKEALDLSVFLTQGGVGKFLFLTDAKRETEFAKMCLIDHLDTVGEIAAQEITRVSKEVTDLTPKKDEAVRNRLEQLDALTVAETALAALKDVSIDIANKRKTIACEATVTEAREHYARVSSTPALVPPAISESKESLRQSLLDLEGKLQAHELADKNRKTALQQLDTLKVLSSRRRQLSDELIGIEQRVSDLSSRTQTLEGVALTLKQLEEEETAAKAALDEEEALALSARDYVAATELLTAYVTETGELDRAISAIEAEVVPSADEIQNLKTEAQSLEKEIQLLPYIIQMATAGSCESDKCVLCGSKEWHGMPSAEEVEGIKIRLSEGRAKVAALLKEASEKESLVAVHARRVVDAKQRYEEAVKRKNDHQFKLMEMKAPGRMADVPAAKQRLSDVTGKLRTCRDQHTTIAAEVAQLQLADAKRSGLRSELAGIAEQISTIPAEEELTKQAADIVAPTELIAQKEATATKLQTLQKFEDDTQKEAATRNEAQNRLNQAEEALRLQRLNTRDTSETLQADLEVLEASQRAYQQALGAKAAATDAFRRAEQRLLEVEESIDAQSHIMDVISQLESIRAHFSRTGIQRHYLSRVFDTLVEITQEQLTEWEEDFQVEKDPNTLFNFLFFRTFDPETLFDQNQLSGGQKIRLALAFVMAVQEVMFPALRFLCVDEPSTHLDESGKEGLVRIFRKIAEKNSNSDAQVFVVDHAPELMAGFSKTFALKKFGEA